MIEFIDNELFSARRLDCRRMAVDGYLILLKHAKWLVRPPAAQPSQMTMFSLVEVKLIECFF